MFSTHFSLVFFEFDVFHSFLHSLYSRKVAGKSYKILIRDWTIDIIQCFLLRLALKTMMLFVFKKFFKLFSFCCFIRQLVAYSDHWELLSILL